GLTEEGADQSRGELLAVLACCGQRLAVIELDAVEPLHGEYSPGWAPPVDLRNVIVRFGHHVLAQLGRRRCFPLKVELAVGPLLELRDTKARTQPRGFAAHGLDVGSSPFVGFDRLCDLLLDAGTQDLDGDQAAV